MSNTILITGFAGFIGSNFSRYWKNKYPNDVIVGFDKMGYASNPGYATVDVTIIGDLSHKSAVDALFRNYSPFDYIFGFAAESHVCNSIATPEIFLQSNVVGTFNLLESIKEYNVESRYVHVSTDEVFGELGPEDSAFTESTPYAPRSPYAASKAASDHFVKAYVETYGINAVITNCSNNYGPNQHLEKLIPKTIECWKNDVPAVLYGDGQNIRDWIHVSQHIKALEQAALLGDKGNSYCIGAGEVLRNIEIVTLVWEACNEVSGVNKTFKFIKIDARKTDDLRYTVNAEKAKIDLNWESKLILKDALLSTVSWYLNAKT